MNYFHATVEIKEDGKCYAYPVRISEADNLVSKFLEKGAVAVHVCKTRKQAREMAKSWNETYKLNDRYMF